MRVLAIDIGSSSTRTALFNQQGRLVPGTTAQRKYSLRYTADGGAELSPVALQRAVRACFRETLQSSPTILAVAGSAFGEPHGQTTTQHIVHDAVEKFSALLA